MNLHMEPKQGLKKETRRHYIGYFLDSDYQIEKLEGTEVYEYDSNGYVLLYKSEYYDDNGDISYGRIAIRRYEKGAHSRALKIANLSSAVSAHASLQA